jgi:hypothetical protein
VCVWVRQIRRLRLTIPFLGGSQGGEGMPPPGYAERSAPGGSPGPTGFGAAPQVRAAFGTERSPGLRGSGQRPEIFFWAVLFAIFSGFCYF